VKLRRKVKRLVPGHEPRLAPGVRGYTVWSGGALYIPIIVADSEGTGDVGRYLDSLPRDRTVKFPTVLNPRLCGMLRRRGFRPVIEDTPMRPCEVWTREGVQAALK